MKNVFLVCVTALMCFSFKEGKGSSLKGIAAYNINAKVSDEGTLLHQAVKNGDIKATTDLIAKGANINAKTTNGDTPLHVATLMGKAEIVKLLIEKGADVNAKNHEGRTPLDIAKEKNYAEIIKAFESYINLLKADLKEERKEPNKHLKIPYNAIKIDEDGGYVKEYAIVEIPNMSASQLYKKTLEWVKKYDFESDKTSIKKNQYPPYHLFLSSKDSIENEKVEIVGFIYKAAHISGSFYDLQFSLKILLREGRYNFKISPAYFRNPKNEKEIHPEDMSAFLQKGINPNEFNYFYNKVNDFHLSLFNYLTDGAVNKDIEKNEKKW